MVRGGKFVEVAWAGIVVGDIVKVQRNNPVPADCVFLASRSEESNTPDTCYVQTAQLDGETNLKLKTAPRQSAEHFVAEEACYGFRGSIRCEAPNASFDKFAGTLQMDAEGKVPAVPLEADNLLLRGSVLRNVDFAYALVVYTGRETKVRVRQTTRQTKTAQVETQLNRMILCLITFLLTLCVLGTVGNVLHTNTIINGRWYFREAGAAVSARVGVEQFFTFFLLNAAFIPVSLYVSVRLARSLQVIFMESDNLMVHTDEEQFRLSDGAEGVYPFKVRSMELNDELGQITHIFSDKTGTLTLNYMEWRKLLVGSVAYGLGTTQIGIDRLRRAGHDVSHLEGAIQAEKLRGKERGAQLPHVNFEDGSDNGSGRTVGSDSRNPRDGGQGTAIHNMLLHLALNHTVLPEVVRDRHGAIVGSRLSASSPDEEAFCYAAETLGYKFVSRTQEGVCLSIRHATQDMPFLRSDAPFPQPLKTKSARLLEGVKFTGEGSKGARASGVDVPFGILHILAYTQERKCMSVVVEHPMVDSEGAVCVTGSGGPSGQRGAIYIYCKGADSAILPKCAPPRTSAEASALEGNKATLQDWGNDGLRTLVFASRCIPRGEYEAWALRYLAACQDLSQLKLKKDKRPNAIDDLQSELETGLTMQGATANEDKLQPEVPETLSLLAKAGIKLWMVTGDKQETAVNIGFATKMLDTSQRQIVVTAEGAGGVLQAMKRLRIAAKRMRAEETSDERAAAEAQGGEGQHQGLAGRVMEWMKLKLLAAESDAARSQGSSGTKSPFNNLSPSSRSLLSFGASSSSAGVSPSIPARADAASRGAREPSAGQRAGETYDSDEDEAKIAEGETAEAVMAGSPLPSAGAAAPSSPSADDARLLPSGTLLSTQSVRDPSSITLMNPAHQSSIALAGAPAGHAAPPLPPSRRPFALVIDEHCLDAALHNERAKNYLLYVAVHCDAVIACRARPDQKARLVRLIRRGLPSSRTLAVGDGANDVDMIGEAHVGVGIAGAEGVQAANASDFSIGRFFFLQRLLLVHGRWNYSRMARVVLYMFWKNVLFVLCQFLYQVNHNGFSGQKWYVEYAAQAFNIVFTGAAPLVMGILDRDLDAPWVLRYPKLYDYGRLAQALTLPVFLAWMADAVFGAIVVFLFTIYGFRAPDFASGVPFGGATPFVFSLGTVAYSSVVVVTNLRVAMEVFHHSRLFQAVVALSVAMWVPVCFILDALRQDGMFGGMQFLFGSASFWLTVLLASGLLGLRMLGWKSWRRLHSPDLRHCVQEVAALGLSSRSIDSYTDSADLARRLGKSVGEVVRAQRAAEMAAEALQSHISVLPLGSPLGMGARVEHFGSSPMRVAMGGADPNDGGYSALGAEPLRSSASMGSRGSSSGMGAARLFGGAGEGGGGLVTPGALAAASGCSASGAALATPISHASSQQERAARSILEGALRPLALPGDGNFDRPLPGEDVDSPNPKAVLQVAGAGGVPAAANAASLRAEQQALSEFRAHVSSSVSRLGP